MGDLTGQTPANTYKDLFHIQNSDNGPDATLRTADLGNGTASKLELSTTKVNVASGFQMNGKDTRWIKSSILFTKAVKALEAKLA
ncbi:MAG: hypothetical protein CMM08_11935 [Rhodospirillaceae bacterium]|jgi:hypothetical protein|nr:hypothetical protein [Rhodospirillaceae bacterium]MDP6624382.1 hypothetical protein [Alphaproteobacteria bacterium]|tara:strand:+ start:728 stop:982 length:255 start_codon:yes stop_codon:yes gene_type:complete